MSTEVVYLILKKALSFQNIYEIAKEEKFMQNTNTVSKCVNECLIFDSITTYLKTLFKTSSLEVLRYSILSNDHTIITFYTIMIRS
jgi:hypothetical protein